MRNLKWILIALLVLLVGFSAYAWHRDGRAAADQGVPDGPLSLTGSAAERGRYLIAAADCAACHTAPGGEEYAGGLAITLPFGTIYSSNLTADAETGLGGWSDDEFVDAVRAGVARGGRHLYPAHPYTSFAGLARNDVLAIRAYLASLPPVKNAVPENTLSFPFSQRGLLPLWNALFQPAVGYKGDSAHDDAWNRGAYLAGALGHCGECHTPRNVAFAPKGQRALSGAVTRGWMAYDITSTGLATWSAEALDTYLSTGRSSGHGLAAGPMKSVVAFGTARLTAADRQALVGFLRGDHPGAATPMPVTSVADPASVGAHLYAGACAGCHRVDAAGAGGPASLAGASSVRDPSGRNVLRVLGEGVAHGGETGIPMPDFARGYSDAERAALANYVLALWGGLTPRLTANDAAAATRP